MNQAITIMDLFFVAVLKYRKNKTGCIHFAGRSISWFSRRIFLKENVQLRLNVREIINQIDNKKNLDFVFNHFQQFFNSFFKYERKLQYMD